MIFAIFVSFLFSAQIVSHDLQFNINPENSMLVAADEFRFETSDDAWFRLGAELEVTRLRVNEREIEIQAIPEENRNYPTHRYNIGKVDSDDIVYVSYAGKLFQDTQNSSFSREKIAMEISATISNDGVFLAASSAFYPMADDDMLHFRTSILLPDGWDAVSEGRYITREKNKLYSNLQFETEFPTETIHIAANKFHVLQKEENGVEFYTFFFPEDSTLAEDYLNKCVDYVAYYENLLSPYPYSKFAVVENFFPTGYGMPSYTVLGKTVVHLPFILYTSLGHEILHNWWGNSVYIGNDGNWCEGLTSYQADYYYKRDRSESAAKQYRKDLLKDFTVYVSEGNDFPLSDFRSRSDMRSRAIGYGKANMIFHMMEEHLGTENFTKALQNVIRDFSHKPANWTDFFAEFSKASDTGLDDFQADWITKTGAPRLRMNVESQQLTIYQDANAKMAWVPVHILNGRGQKFTEHLLIDGPSSQFDLRKYGNVTEVIVDPDYNLMRELLPEELDPTIREMLDASQINFVIPEDNHAWNAMAMNWAEALSSGGEYSISTEANSVVPNVYLGKKPQNLVGQFSDKNFQLQGESIDSDDNSVVFAFKEGDNSALMLYSTEPSQLSAIIRKIPHYGKYGYLSFASGKVQIKGNHEITESPLHWTLR